MAARTRFEDIPGVAAPCRGALRSEGYPDVESLDGVDYATLIVIHGVGQRGLERLQAALVERGMSLSGDVPTPASRATVYTAGHTGTNAPDIKTAPITKTATEYIESLDTPRRVEHGRLLLEMFGRVTGAEPVVWGPSMIGYGEVHYRYETGWEGDTFQVGFSPRKAKISLYGLKDHPGAEEQLNSLGKYTEGAGCIYINKPEDVDLDILEQMIRDAWSSLPQ